MGNEREGAEKGRRGVEFGEEKEKHHR